VAEEVSERSLKEILMKKIKAPHLASGPIRPHHAAGIGYHSGRAIHGSNPKMGTTETKTAPKAPKPKAPHTKKFKV
jgi:hypothetical protein